VAQGQIWITIPNEGISYYTTMQTIPLEFGEEISFFPLGSVDGQDGARIEVKLVLYPYTEGSPPEGSSPEGTSAESSPAEGSPRE
jgi:hypothetical protein